MSSATTRRVTLSPTPGFCVKTKIESLGIKVFLNIAWDTLVPPPPTGVTPEAIEDPNYVIPLIVGDLKTDVDKKGIECKVVDCVYSKELKSKALREPDFKQFLSAVALERVEERYDLRLSRAIATPNISSKGKLESRSVVVPIYGITQPQAKDVPQMQPNGVPQTVPPSAGSKPLIEEIGGSSSSQSDAPLPRSSSKSPAWSIRTLQSGQIRVDLEMADLTQELAQQAALYVEPQRIIFSVGTPPIYEFDQRFPSSTRDFHVDSAKAEWNINTKKLSIIL